MNNKKFGPYPDHAGPAGGHEHRVQPGAEHLHRLCAVQSGQPAGAAGSGCCSAPAPGFAVGAVADIIGGVLAGYAINPLITLGAGAIGLVAGFAWQKLPGLRTNLRLISVLLGHLWVPWSSPRWRCASVLRLPVGNAGSAHPQRPHPGAVNVVLLRILLDLFNRFFRLRRFIAPQSLRDSLPGEQARPQTFRLSQKLSRYAKGSLSEGAVKTVRF